MAHECFIIEHLSYGLQTILSRNTNFVMSHT